MAFARACLAAALALLLAPPASAQDEGVPSSRELAAAERYAECMRTARSAPEAAIERARTWADTGGGDPARHCEAVALINAGDYTAGAERLENLAKTMSKGTAVKLRADALAQAGQAWLLAGAPARAEAAQSAALELRPEDAELWIDRALTRFQMGDTWKAIDDLNRASELAPRNPIVYVYRATAYRHVDSPELAREDVARALELAPNHPEALLEKGILARLEGNKDAARRAWLKLLDVAPDSPAAQAARGNLENMDVRLEEESG